MKERRQPDRIVAFVMAGGKGTRLHPLTAERCKPAVPFGGRYRLVDFVLSNLIHSGIRSIYLLVQYQPQSLIEHIRKAWVISPLLPDQFVTVVPPQLDEGGEWFKGTADAVYQNLQLIETYRPDLVAVFGADHVYRMDVRQMVRFHRDRSADVTVAALPVPLEEARSFGVIAAGSDGRIQEFQEKPEQPRPIPGRRSHAYASMGNYLFSADVLLEMLMEGHHRGEHDFGHDVLPRLLRNRSVYAYDFSTNEVPGVKTYEEQGYWRDVGTVDAYYEAHLDTLGQRPRFDAFNPSWPIFSSNYQGPVAQIMGGELDNCLCGAATVIRKGAKLRNCIVRREAIIDRDAELEDCIIMDYAFIGRGARLRRVIVDRNNIIPPGTQIGFDHKADGDRYFVSEGGIVVVPKGRATNFAREPGESGPGYAE